MSRRVLVLGDGGHANAVAVLLEADNYIIAGLSRKGEDEAALRYAEWDCAVVGLGCSDLWARTALFELIQFPVYGTGTIIFPQVVRGIEVTIGCNVVVYSGSIVEHGSVIGAHAWLSPGVILCGNVTVKRGAFLGAGAIVAPGVTIGEGAFVEMGARVTHDVPDGGRVKA